MSCTDDFNESPSKKGGRLKPPALLLLPLMKSQFRTEFCRSFLLLPENCEDHTHSNFENYYYQMNMSFHFLWPLPLSLIFAIDRLDFLEWAATFRSQCKWLLEKKVNFVPCPSCIVLVYMHWFKHEYKPNKWNFHSLGLVSYSMLYIFV